MSPTTNRCGATTTTKKVWAATTARAVERGQYPRTCTPGSKDAAERQLVAGACRNRRRPVPVRGLRNIPGLSVRLLLFGAVPHAVLFTVPDHQLHAGGQ